MSKFKNSDASNGDDVTSSDAFWKAIATLGMWVFVTGGMALIGIFMAPAMGEDALGAVFMLMAAAVVISGFIWNWGQVPGQESNKQARRNARKQRRQERHHHDNVDDEYYDLYYAQSTKKGKNSEDRLAAALKQLSDEELVGLRERIARGEIREEDLESVLLEDDYR